MLYNEKYYKVINSDNLIMDVLDSDSISYVMWQEHNGMLLSCNSLRTKLLAQGILSSDQTIVWHTAELKDFPDTAPDYETVKLGPIDEETYLKLKKQKRKTRLKINQKIKRKNLRLIFCTFMNII